jgi:hypothetical protein
VLSVPKHAFDILHGPILAYRQHAHTAVIARAYKSVRTGIVFDPDKFQVNVRLPAPRRGLLDCSLTRWYMFEEKREAVTAIEAAVLPLSEKCQERTHARRILRTGSTGHTA